MTSQNNLLTAVLLLLSLALLSSGAVAQGNAFQEDINKYLPFTGTVIIGSAKAVTSKLQTDSDTNSTDGIVVEEYDIDVSEIILTTEDSVENKLKLVSLGGELIRVNQNGKKFKEIHSVSGWPKINELGDYLIFVEHSRRNRNISNNIYLTMNYRIISSGEKQYIELNNNHNSQSRKQKIELDDAISMIQSSISLLDSYVYNTDMSQEGAYAID